MPATAVESTAPIAVVLGVVLREGRVLVGWRDSKLHQGNCWEFPGGKVKATETRFQTLLRELHEEVGITIKKKSVEPLIAFEWRYDAQRYFFSVYLIKDYSGELKLDFYSRLKWQALETLKESDFPPANRAIIKSLLLPNRYLVTPVGLDLAAIEKGLTVAFQSGISMAVFRAPKLDNKTYIDSARRLLLQNPVFNTGLLIHNHPTQVHELNAAGVQLSAEHAKKYCSRPVSKEVLLAVSCHSRLELEHACRIDADFALLGPIKITPSHLDDSVLGWTTFKILAESAPMPVYAIGGLEIGDLAKYRAYGAQGIAAIRGFWPL
ncbi:MAG: Nudix family hydrolase [Chromatiales bacterium]|nr:Nudix family hydrolase [Chromatiales bacterium]